MKYQSVSTLVFILLLVLKSVAFGYKFSGNCEVYTKNSEGKYVLNGSGFLTASEPNQKFRGLSTEEQYFVTTAHQDYDLAKAILAGNANGTEIINKAVCGGVTFEYVKDSEASKEIKFVYEKQKIANRPKECEIDSSTRTYNLREKPFVWSGCDLSVNRIKLNTVTGGRLSDIQPYSTQIEFPTKDAYKFATFEVIYGNSKQYFACPIVEHYAGGQVANCSLKHRYTQNIKTIDDVNAIGISSGTVVLARNGEKVAKLNKNPIALGVVTAFVITKNEIEIRIENLKMSGDIILPDANGSALLAQRK